MASVSPVSSVPKSYPANPADSHRLVIFGTEYAENTGAAAFCSKNKNRGIPCVPYIQCPKIVICVNPCNLWFVTYSGGQTPPLHAYNSPPLGAERNRSSACDDCRFIGTKEYSICTR